MGRKAGQLVRCTCVKCGGIEMLPGCTSGFVCLACKPNQNRVSLKSKAHVAVAGAIRKGLLQPARNFACVDCGGPAIEYEHRDYTKPLEVQPICRRCNLRRGPAIGSDAMRRTTVYITSPGRVTHAAMLARDIA